MDDRLKAFGTGAGQAATAGWQDEAVAKLLSAFPVDDGTGIQRNYAAGSAEEDLKKTFRSENADLERRFPGNYAAGGLVGAAPAALATGGAGGLGAVAGGVGLGALAGAGSSENKGAELAKDAVRGGAVGGIGGAAGNIASAAGPAMAKLWKQGPPSAPQPALATAGAGQSAVRPSPSVNNLSRPQMNMSEAMPSQPPAAPRSMPPASLDAAEVEARAALRRAEAMDEIRKRPFRPDSGPLDYVPSNIPEHENLALEKTRFRHGTEEADAEVFRRKPKAVQTEDSVAKTARPPRRPKAEAPAQAGAGLARLEQAGPPAPSTFSVDRPLLSPRQLPDERILELARSQPRAPWELEPAKPHVPLTKDQLAVGRQSLGKMGSGGNVVDLGDGAIQVADDPFVAGRVREFQQHARSAEQAGDADAAEWFKEQIEQLLASSGQ